MVSLSELLLSELRYQIDLNVGWIFVITIISILFKIFWTPKDDWKLPRWSIKLTQDYPILIIKKKTERKIIYLWKQMF